jgi:hypothetical protein
MSDCICPSANDFRTHGCSARRQQPSSRWGACVALVCLLTAAACADGTVTDDEEPAPAVVETVSGQDTKILTLTEQAAGRLRITTVAVAASAVGTSVPYAAIGYDPDGATWVYTSPSEFTYVRELVTVDDVENGIALLSAGPAVGTAVVTVGVAELFGTEHGIGQ